MKFKLANFESSRSFVRVVHTLHKHGEARTVLGRVGGGISNGGSDVGVANDGSVERTNRVACGLSEITWAGHPFDP
jgi:hypothetical protein